MATVVFSMMELEKRGIERGDIQRLIDRLGASVEGLEGDSITVEFTPQRPDLLETNGLARALRLIGGNHTPSKSDYQVSREPYFKILVTPAAARTKRFVGGMVVKGAELSGGRLKELINFTEKYCDTYGRRRRKIAIGLHSLAAVKGNIRYDAARGGSITPLGTEAEMQFSEVLKRSEQGRAYSEIMDAYKSYPYIADDEKTLALVPIINSEMTRVTESTKDLFIDITSSSMSALDETANILACMFIDSRAKVMGCAVELQAGKGYFTPSMEYREMRLRSPRIEKSLGIVLDNSKMVSLGNRMGHVAAKYGNGIIFFVPPYRVDVLGERDLIEDIAIAYGYDRIKPLPVYGDSVGVPDELVERGERVSLIELGLGFSEAMGNYLTNEEQNFDMMRRSRDGAGAVAISYSKTGRISMLRTSVLPSLMSALSKSSQERMPQRLFEIGGAFRMEGGRPVERTHVSMVSEHTRSNFSEMKAYVNAIVWAAGAGRAGFERHSDPAFIEGRCASVSINGRRIGVMGEIHPEVLSNFRIEEPVSAAELELEALFQGR